MLIYPVIDLKGGLVVRGIAGDRARYQPIKSRLVDSAEPLLVARAFRERLGLDRIYLADLDALGGAPPASRVIESLASDGFLLLVDAGVRSSADSTSLFRLGASEVIAPLETLPGPTALGQVISAAGWERVIFSLDMKNGALLGDASGWSGKDPELVAREAHERGARRILLLDLAHVGSGKGPAGLRLLSSLARKLPDVQLLSGGGIRSADDLRLLGEAGASGALIASAFHDGAITRLS